MNSYTKPVCIVVNGPSAVGKSTLVSRIQDASEIPLLRFGIDQLYPMVPAQWAGGTPNARKSLEGFTYIDAEFDDAPGGRTIRNGTDALRMLRAMNAAIIAVLNSGMNVIVDGQAYERDINDEFHKSLAEHASAGDIETTIIELTAGHETLLDRQSRHAHPADITIAQQRAGLLSSHPHLVLDTSQLSEDSVFARVWDLLVQRHCVLSSG